jgi:acetyltransferase-like isoleucine patch superfamily enzyme
MSMLTLYRFKKRLAAKAFSILFSRSFASFGKHSVINPPLRISGEKRIKIGNNVFLGADCWLNVLTLDKSHDVAIEIGDGTSIVGSVTLSAVHNIMICEKVLIAKNVYISDHSHEFLNIKMPVKEQGLSKIRSVVIKSGAWLGQNVVVFPGVIIGKNSVIGANSVVTSNIPDYATAAGSPAKIIRKFDNFKKVDFINL